MRFNRPLSAMASLALLCLAAHAPAEAGQSANSTAWTDTASAPRIGQGLGIRAGTAPIEDALGILIPAPYKIQLDSTIPRTLILQWNDQPDWMSALRQAAAPMGLRVLPNWASNTVTIASALLETKPTTLPAPVRTSGAIEPFSKGSDIAQSSVAPAVAAPTVVDTPAPTKPEPKLWMVLPTDGKLANTLERWAKQEGLRLIWDAQQHVMLSASDNFTGSFEDAVTRTLSSPAIRQSAYPLEGCIYPNNPPVLRITRLGDQAQECPQ